MQRRDYNLNREENRKALVVRETYNDKPRDLAYFPEDAFDLFDPELSIEQKEYYAKQLTASAVTFIRQNKHFNDEYLPINVLSFIQLHDRTYSIYVSDRNLEHKILYAQGQQGGRTGLDIAQTESYASTLSVERTEYRYDFAYNRTPVIDSEFYKTLKNTKEKQLRDFLEGRIRIEPPKTVSPKRHQPQQSNAKFAKNAAAFFDIDGIRDQAIARLETLGDAQKQLETNLELARKKVASIKDEQLKRFATTHFTKLEDATKIKLDSLKRNAIELQGTLEFIDTQLIAAWKPRIETAVQIEHAKKLLICAIYNAAIDYFVVIQEKKEGRKEKIAELNACFEGIIKFGEDGTFTTVEDAYNNLLTRFSEVKLKEFCEKIIERSNTSKVAGFTYGTSTKLELIASNIQRYASEHELSEFGPLFRLDGLKISFSFNQENIARELDAKDSRTRNVLADLSNVLVSQLKSVESDLTTAQVNFVTFESNLGTREALLKTISDLAVLRKGGADYHKKIQADIASIASLQSDPAVSDVIIGILAQSDFETVLRNLQINIEKMGINTNPSLFSLSEDNCDQDNQFQKTALQRRYFAKQAMREILEIEKTIKSVLADCNEANERIKHAQALEAQRAQKELLEAVDALESAASSLDLSRSNGSVRNLDQHLVSAAVPPDVIPEPRLEAVAEAPREPEQRGFFKRHLAKLIGGSTGAVIGAGIGATVGFALLPFTFGLSVPLFAAIGGVIGGAAVGVGVGTGIGAIVDSTPPEPKKPGFFKRHLAKLIGGSTGAIVGAGIGAAIGFALLPFTFGLSVPLFAAIGGVIGGAIVGVTVGAGVGAAIDKSSAKKRSASAAVREERENDSFRSTHARVSDDVPPGRNLGNSHQVSASVAAGYSPSQAQRDLSEIADEAMRVSDNLRRSFN